MTAATTSTPRPRAVLLLVGVLSFLSLTAVGGGAEMIAFRDGNQYLPAELLDGVPMIDTFLVPGLVLGVGFGVGSGVAAAGIWTRHRVTWLGWLQQPTGRHWSWSLAVLVGVGFATWMAVEWLVLGAPWDGDTLEAQVSTWILYGIYDLVAVALLVLPHLASVQEHLAVPDQVPVRQRTSPGHPHRRRRR